MALPLPVVVGSIVLWALITVGALASLRLAHHRSKEETDPIDRFDYLLEDD